VRESTAGVVLAAGASTRMGEPKLIMPYGASTVIGTVVATMGSSTVDDVVVVTGFHSEAVVSVLPPETRIAHNERAATGNASSLQAGLEIVKDVDAVVIAVGDMPGVTAASINRLIDLWRGSAYRFCVIEYVDGRGHPVLLDRSLFGAIQDLSGERALWAFAGSLDSSAIGVVRLSVQKPADINSLEDYQGAVQAQGFS
jgi:molybdenum cofactor cytidylyltransferase